MSKKHFDFIIVGQGLAGTLLAHFLIQNGKSVLLFDQHNPSSSSNIAAGIIHPITGRRLVKTWLFDEAYPVSRSTYSILEKQFSEELFKEILIVEIYTSTKNRNDWIERSGTPGYELLISDELPAGFDQSIHCPFGAIKLAPTGFLHISKLLALFRNYLAEQNILIGEKFDFQNLSFKNDKVVYQNFEAEKIILCEGYHAQNNPFFKGVPFQLAKGEVIIVKCDRLREDMIINKAIYIQPIGNGLFRVGSTYDWQNLNHESTPESRQKLTEQFASIIALPFTIESQHAAVRPTMKNRRPAIGLHPKNKSIGIFNGLGTKGVLLAPYLANHFARHLVHGTDLMKDIQIEISDDY